MIRPAPLLPSEARALLAPLLAAGLAGALLCWALALHRLGGERATAPVRLLVSALDPDPERRDRSAAIAAGIMTAAGVPVHRLTEADLDRALGDGVLAGLPHPLMMQGETRAAAAATLAARLRAQAGVTVVVEHRAASAPSPAGRLATLALALGALLAAAHGTTVAMAARAPALRVLRRLGTPPRRLAAEALLPPVAAVALGAVFGDLLAMLALRSAPALGGVATPWAAPPLVLAAGLLGGLTPLRRLLGGAP